MISERKYKYNKFIDSPWWKHLRQKKLGTKGKCFICTNNKYLQIHHLNYKNLYKGKQNEALKNTLVLCFNCHKAVHETQKERGLNVEQTKEIVFEFKKEYETFSRQAKNFYGEFYSIINNA